MNSKEILGSVEYVWLTDEGIRRIPARIDTGARTTAIWASNIVESAAGLSFVLFDQSYHLYTGTKITRKSYTKIAVKSSTGHVQLRYKIAITIQLSGKKIKTFGTLSDRSAQTFPLLIGRNTLRGKYVVDVQRGPRILKKLDRTKHEHLQQSFLQENQT